MSLALFILIRFSEYYQVSPSDELLINFLLSVPRKGKGKIAKTSGINDK